MNKQNQTTKTQDGFEVKDGTEIWYVNGPTVHGTKLVIGRHNLLYKIYKSKTNALKAIR